MCFGLPEISAFIPGCGMISVRWSMISLISRSRSKSLLSDVIGNFFVLLRIDVAERQIFELPFHLPDTQPVSQRSKYIQRLLRDTATFMIQANGSSVRILCSRSANLIKTTRTSSPMARKVFRRVSETRSYRRFFVRCSGAYLPGWAHRVGPPPDVILPPRISSSGCWSPLDTLGKLRQLGHPVDQFGHIFPKIISDVIQCDRLYLQPYHVINPQRLPQQVHAISANIDATATQ